MESLDDVNPFKHRLNLTTWDYVTSVLCGLVLIPIRIILIVVIVLVGWLGAVIYTHDYFKNPEGIPNSKLRLKTYEFLLKLLSWCQCYKTFLIVNNVFKRAENEHNRGTH